MVRNVIARPMVPAFDRVDECTTCLLPETGYLRLHQIIGRPARNGRPAIPAIIPVSRSTWWEGVKSGRYPQPVRCLGQRITAWRVEDVLNLISATGTTHDNDG